MNLDIIIKVLCGVACAIIAKNKGYSMILGFIMGYFIHIIGLLIAIFIKNKE